MNRFLRIFLMLIVLGMGSFALGQETDPLVEQGVKLRIEEQELAYLRRTSQISPENYTGRAKQFALQMQAYKQQVGHLPAADQTTLRQNTDNRYAVVFPPIQQKWNAEATRLAEEAKALTAARNKDLETDAQVAAGLQTDRVFRQRHNTQDPAADSADITKITTLQSKYTSYGGAWVANFNRRVEGLTNQMVKERDLKERLADTTTPVGQDAHRTVEINLIIRKNQIWRSARLLDPAQEEKQEAPLKTELDAIQAKYAVGAPLAGSVRDFNERVTLLTNKGAQDYRDEWTRQLQVETAARRPTPPPPAPVAQASTVDTSYLKEMPEADRVVSDFQSGDNLETVGKQWGALYQLRGMIEVESDGRVYRNQLTGDEEKLRAAYTDAMNHLTQPKFDDEETKRLGANSPRAKWFATRTHYELDKGFRDDLFKRYFSADWQNHFRALENAQAARLAMQRQMTTAAAQRPMSSVSRPVNWTGTLVSWMIMLGIVLAIPLLLVIRPAVRAYNELVRLRNVTENAWAQIDVQLKRRHDLISNFVETVKGYAKHERGTLEDVTKARATAAGAKTVTERAGAEQALNDTMRTLYSVVESYPDLKANQNFIALQQSLTTTEDLLATSRQTYNNTVTAYMTRVQSFPMNFFATVFRFKKRDYFELSNETERERPVAAFE